MTSYNGWTNYATWRVNLELVDGLTLQDFTEETPTAYILADRVRDYVDTVLDARPSDPLVRDYANAFLAQVNWQEIAQHLLNVDV